MEKENQSKKKEQDTLMLQEAEMILSAPLVLKKFHSTPDICAFSGAIGLHRINPRTAELLTEINEEAFNTNAKNRNSLPPLSEQVT